MTNPNDPWSNPYGQPGQPAEPGQPQYTQPQYTQPQYTQPQYGQPQYGQPSEPNYGPPAGQSQYGQPGYGQPQYGQYGPPMPPAQFGPPGTTNRRPGAATAAAVLSYVQAGFLIIIGIFLLAGAGFSSDVGDSFNADTGSLTGELAADGLVNLALGAGFIVGGIMLTMRRGRILLVATCVANFADCVYWVIRNENTGKALVLFFVVLPAIALGLAFSSTVSGWLSGRMTRV